MSDFGLSLPGIPDRSYLLGACSFQILKIGSWLKFVPVGHPGMGRPETRSSSTRDSDKLEWLICESALTSYADNNRTVARSGNIG